MMPLLGGRVRPVVVLLFLALLPFLGTSAVPVMATLGILSLFTLGQIALRKQRKPVWTSKARAVLAGAIVLDTAIAVILSFQPLGFMGLPLLPLIQSVILALSWAAFLPVDRHLKRKIMARAKVRRESHPELTVIGITGSVGKTTTKELLAHILHDRRPLFTPAHVNSEMGVAQWILKNIRQDPLPEATPLIVEMGAYRTGEIATLCGFVQPKIGIVTFVGSQHLALFGSQEALVSAKGELLRSLPRDGHAFLNGDSDLTRGMQRFCACPVTVVGTGGAADLEAYDIEETPTGIRFSVGGVSFSLPLHGTHNVANVLLTITVAESLGMTRQAIAERVRSFQPPHRTFEVRQENGVTILDDTHNASAMSFQAAVAWARTQPFERKTLLASGIIELGEEHQRTHRELGSQSRNVFREAVFLERKSAALFAEGYGKPVPLLTEHTPRVPAGSLLVCVGRMTPATIRRLLPPADDRSGQPTVSPLRPSS